MDSWPREPLSAKEHARWARRVPRPVLFVLDHDPNSLDVLVDDLERRFGHDFAVRGDSSPEAALAALKAMAKANDAVALLLVEDNASDFLARGTSCIASKTRPSRRSRLLVDEPGGTGDDPGTRRLSHRQAVGPRRVDVRREYLSSWTSEQGPGFELFPGRRRGARPSRARAARRDDPLQHAVRV